MAATGLRERNRAAAMSEIRRVALELMALAGFDAVKVDDVAGAAGVSPSTVYRYFGTKEALVLDGDRPDRLVRALTDSDVADPMPALLNAAVDAFADDAGLSDELDLIAANAPLVEAFERQLLDRRPEVADILAERRHAKSPGLRDEAAAAAGLALIVTTLLRWQRTGGDKSLKKTLTKAFAAVG